MSLLDAVRRYAQTYADPGGVARTPVPGLTVIRATRPTGLDYAISRPLVALVVNGSKDVTMGARTVTVCSGDSLLSRPTCRR